MFPEHPSASRRIPEHPGASRNIGVERLQPQEKIWQRRSMQNENPTIGNC